MTLQEFVDQINSQIKGIDKLTHAEMLHTSCSYVAMFRNEFNEVPNFDIDDYGRIELLGSSESTEC